jgi:hypothetical protein
VRSVQAVCALLLVCLGGTHVLPALDACADEAEEPRASGIDEDLPPIRFGLNYQIVGAGFDLVPRVSGGEASRLNFRPAQSDYVGVMLGYRWLGGTVAFGVPAEPKIRDVEGTSQYRDYRLSYFFGRYGFELGYSRYLGYLLENSSVLSPATLQGATYYKIPDLETLGYGVTILFALSPETYSLSAALDQSAIQTSSGGSTIFLMTFRHQSLQSATPFIPSEKRADFGQDQELREAEGWTLSYGAGYAYLVALDPFFFPAWGLSRWDTSP